MDRRQAVPALIGDHRDFLIVTGLAGAAKDIAHLSDDGAHVFTMAGAMGAAVSIGLGLALAKPERRVLVVTGDGELLMNVGALATVAVMRPPNLAVVCVDNGHYGETGGQLSHTSLGVDLEAMAAAAGIPASRTVGQEDEISAASKLLRESNGPAFVVLKVRPGDPPAYKRNMDAAACRTRFRAALLGT
jgi:thiamine pyrophosphate-dependent acetolactate synthase large subunit-like protein